MPKKRRRFSDLKDKIFDRVLEKLLIIGASAVMVGVPTWWKTSEDGKVSKNIAIANAVQSVSKAIHKNMEDCE